MFHETNASFKGRATGPVYLSFGTASLPGHIGGDNLVALGVELDYGKGLTSHRSNLMMTPAEAMRFSDELRRLASEVSNKLRR